MTKVLSLSLPKVYWLNHMYCFEDQCGHNLLSKVVALPGYNSFSSTWHVLNSGLDKNLGLFFRICGATGPNRTPHRQAGLQALTGRSAMGPSEEGILFGPRLGRAHKATQGPQAHSPPVRYGRRRGAAKGDEPGPAGRGSGRRRGGPGARWGRSGGGAAVATDARRWRRPTPVHMDSRRGLG